MMDTTENPEEDPRTFDEPKIQALPAPKANINMHTFELFKDYTLPEWSAKPTKDFFFEVVRNGAFLEERKINEKEFYLVGKLPDLCDIVLDHETISRKHALFQHSRQGDVFLYDLGSTHGTTVNRKKIASREHVKLRIGDSVKFGLSSRVFILGVDGQVDPFINDQEFQEEEQANEIKSAKQELKDKYLQLLAAKHESNGGGFGKKIEKNIDKKKRHTTVAEIHGEGANWGMLDEEVIYATKDEDDFRIDPEILRKLPDLTEKDLEKIEGFETKLRKFKNMESELRQIYEKEQQAFGLSEENQRRKQNMTTKVNQLAQQLEITEDNLKFHFFEENAKEKKKKAMMQDDDTFGDDEFFDRTIVKKKKDNDGEAVITASEITEDFHSLKRKLEDLITQRRDINEQVLALSMNKTKDEEAEIDELDKFMEQNEEKSRDEKKLKLINALKETEAKIAEAKKLLKVVQPTFVSDEQEIDKRLQQQEAEKQELIKKQEHHRIERQKQQATKTMQQLKDSKAKADPSSSLKANLSLAEQKEQKPSENSQGEEESTAATKKVYSVAQKPPPRNLKEKDFEEKQNPMEWTPPSDANQNKLEQLKKKLGY